MVAKFILTAFTWIFLIIATVNGSQVVENTRIYNAAAIISWMFLVVSGIYFIYGGEDVERS